MDTELLDAELSAAETQRDEAVREMAQAAAARDLAKAAIADARLRLADSAIATVQHKRARAEIRASQDGCVLSGDIRHRVGEIVPLGEPLVQLAAGDAWVVELRVPESAVAWLREELDGEFTTNARPDESARFTLQNLDVSAAVVRNQNVFLAKGRIQGRSSPWLRVGMQGVARVEAGRKPVWWVWLHGLIDTLRLQVWKW